MLRAVECSHAAIRFGPYTYVFKFGKCTFPSFQNFTEVAQSLMYAWIAQSAKAQDSVWLALVASMALPTLFWSATKVLRKSSSKF